MRLSHFALPAIILVAVLGFSPQAKSVNYGGYTCSQPVPCEDDGSFTASQWAQAGNACVAQGFGYSNPNGFIDDSAGLSGSKCLSGIQGSLPNKQLVPTCCVVKVSDNICALDCELGLH